MLFRCKAPNSNIGSHLRLNNVALAGIKSYMTQNSLFFGDHWTACIGPLLPIKKNKKLYFGDSQKCYFINKNNNCEL